MEVCGLTLLKEKMGRGFLCPCDCRRGKDREEGRVGGGQKREVNRREGKGKGGGRREEGGGRRVGKGGG